MKIAKKFSFIFPVSQEFKDHSRRKGKRIMHVSDLVINGVGYDNGACTAFPSKKRFEINIEEVSDNGVNILPVLKAFECLQEITQACLHHVYSLFSGEKIPCSAYQSKTRNYHW